jgi:signal peptidase I
VTRRAEYAWATLFLLAGVAGVFLLRGKGRPPETGGGCAEKREVFTMDDDELPGVLALGEGFDADLNWYSCHAPQRGETVLFRIAKELPPKVKVVRAVEGDRFDVKPDAAKEHWHLVVNGEIVPDYQGKPYYFGGPSLPTLGLYSKPRNGRVREGELIVLSTRSHGNSDSAVLGIVSLRDIVGRVVPKRR